MICFFISLLVFLLEGWVGMLVLATSTALGMMPVLLNIGRNHAMGVLLLPVMLYFLL